MLQKSYSETAEARGDLIANKIADRITTVSKISPQNNSETNEEKVLKEQFIPSEQGHKIIGDLGLKEKNY